MADPVAVWSGELTAAGVTLHVHVLDDGQRIIEAASLTALLDAIEGGGEITPGEAEAFARWQRGDGPGD